ncbi:FxDxF family PEP-CTERM protein [Novosphingobium sp. RD2P27]|uniref:FxDxF family PEP-CTERM protein n=1 Tax=Novosphingobium kalidii TaxID=3230299 RepID=A0ABV2CXS0_9SPHN
MPGRQVLITSAVIASALAVCAPAQAASTFAGDGSSSIVNGTGAFYDSMIPAGMFTDTIEFSVGSAGTSDVGVLYFKTVAGITDLAASFNGTPITFEEVGGVLFAGGLSKSVDAGLQVLTITGKSGGAGAYSGTAMFSAIPEVATWLMMIAGIGFTGFAMRQRKADAKVSYAF